MAYRFAAYAGLLAACSSGTAWGAEVSAQSRTPDPTAFAEYQSLKAKVGGGAEAQVRLALWCEEHGLTAERLKHLAVAVAREPANPLARGLMGLMAYKGRWMSPDAVKNDGSEATALAEYNARRDALDRREGVAEPRGRRGWHAARAHARFLLARERFQLGEWCEQAGLAPEATAEFTTAVHIDPHFDDAWKRLGYVRHDGRWVPAEQVAAEAAEAKARLEANIRWERLLKLWKTWLRDPARRDEAEGHLASVSDPRAVHSIEKVFLRNSDDDQARAGRMLAAIDSPESSLGLARLAVFSAFEAVRRDAIAALAHRRPRDYVDKVVGLIHTPPAYAIQPIQGPGSRGILVVDTPRYHLERSYDAPPAFQLGSNFYGYIGYDANGLPVAARGRDLDTINEDLSRGQGAAAAIEVAKIEARTAELIAAANLKAAVAQQRLASDVRELEQQIHRSHAINGWVAGVLQATVGAPDLKDDEDAWQTWWYDQVGYRYTPPEKVFVTQSLSTLPAPRLASCFVAGTPVRTIQGPRPIESIRPGDRVLAQDTATGALGFRAVVAVHHNPPGATVRLALDNGETLVPSTYHRLWLAGKGWAMARDLKPGDSLRALGGRVRVIGAEPGEVVPVYNLDVAGDHTYFVGRHDCLVHDNTLPGDVDRPFDVTTAPPAAGASIAPVARARVGRPVTETP